MTSQQEANALLAEDQARRQANRARQQQPTLGDMIEAMGKLGMADDFARIFGGTK